MPSTQPLLPSAGNMGSVPTGDVLEFDTITVHIDLAPDGKLSEPSNDKILEHHQSFLKKCKLLRPNGIFSLHIHKAPAPYEDVVNWFQTVFANVTAAAAFLGGSLLSTATGDLSEQHAGIRSVAATGAMLFILVFLLSSDCTLLFGFAGNDIAKIAGGTEWRSSAMRGLLSTLSFTLQALPVAGSCCLFWVLRDYVSGVGVVGFAVTVVLGLLP